MWNALVSLIRLPATAALLFLATTISLPLMILFGVACFIGGYAVSPLVLVYHAFNNERREFESYMEGLNKIPSDVPKEINSMYEAIFKWGFPS